MFSSAETIDNLGCGRELYRSQLRLLQLILRSCFLRLFNTYTVWTGLLTLISINSSSHLWWGPANVPMSNACLNRGFPFCYLWWLFQASQLRHWSKPSSALFEMIQSFVCRATLQELVICEILHFPISWTPHHPIVCLVSIVTMN